MEWNGWKRAALAGGIGMLMAGAAGASELRALSESEMSGVYGRGLGESSLAGLGALTSSEQSASALPAAGDPATLLGMLSTDSAKSLDRQLAQQQFQVATTGLQSTLKLAQTLSTMAQALAPLSAVTLPTMSLPFLGLPLMPTMPALPALPSQGNGGKH